MNTAEIIVTLTGIGLSVFVIWFFFFSKNKQRRLKNRAKGGD